MVARRSSCPAPPPAAAQAFFAAFYEALLGGRSVLQVGRCSARVAAAGRSDACPGALPCKSQMTPLRGCFCGRASVDVRSACGVQGIGRSATDSFRARCTSGGAGCGCGRGGDAGGSRCLPLQLHRCGQWDLRMTSWAFCVASQAVPGSGVAPHAVWQPRGNARLLRLAQLSVIGGTSR